MNTKIKVFDYYPGLDAFLCTKEFKEVNGLLGLNEWTPVVWMGRLFARDQDFGEHWFDNWDEREELEEKNIPFDFPDGEEWQSLLIVLPERLTEHNAICIGCMESFEKLPCPKCGGTVSVRADGPCHSDETKKLFWTDVLQCLTISFDTMVSVAREYSVFLDKDGFDNPKHKQLDGQIELAKKYLEEKD